MGVNSLRRWDGVKHRLDSARPLLRSELLYAYTYNDPLNRTDPTGNDAYVKVWDDGRVEIKMPFVFSGDAASSENISSVSNNISSSLSGQFGDYNVTTTVQAITAADAKTAPLYNTAEITSGPTDKNGGHSYVKNGNEMHVTMKDVKGQGISTGKRGEVSTSVKGANTPGHEGGHVAGLPDVKGDKGNLMDEGKGKDVSGPDVNTIIQAPGNMVQHCVSAIGVCN